MTVKTIRIGSRRSQLAMWQTEFVVNLLKEKCPEYNYEIIPIKTKGDKLLDVALAKIGDKGLFTKELEIAILNKEIDFAVHSMKDLPTVLPEGLIIASMTKRHDPRDVLISKNNLSFYELPKGAKIGTSSLRRKAQLLNNRKDLTICDIRGNINTRLKKFKEENFDAIVLASAGIERLGLEDMISEKIDYSICLPAVGQGSIGIETRADDEEIINLVRSVNDIETELCVLSERALLRALEGGCQVPIGAFANINDKEIVLEAMVARLDGETLIRDKVCGSILEPEILGEQLAINLKKQGADKILNSIRRELEK